jgi:KaiC/GvpD/RAD55 family RecA-like ATPase
MDLGYCANRDAVVIPVRCQAKLVGFIFRQPAAQPQSEATLRNVLIGLPMGDTKEENDLILVADPLDALRLQAAGIIDVAATGSASITDDQIDLIKRFNPRRVILVRGRDNVAKELEAAVKQRFTKELIPLSVVVLDAKDVSDYLKEHSKERLVESLQAAKSSGLLDRSARSSSELFAWLAAQPPALQTGYPKFDKSVRIALGAMTIIAGRPKHGKTTFLYNLMMQMVESGLYQGKMFYFFSYEESGNRLKQKMLSRLIAATGTSASKIAAARKWDIKSCGDLIQRYAKELQADPKYPRIPEIEDAAAKLDALLGSIKIVNDPLSVEELDHFIRKLNDREPIAAIFIDYIQRIPSKEKTNSLREAVNHVSNTLKWCALQYRTTANRRSAD